MPLFSAPRCCALCIRSPLSRRRASWHWGESPGPRLPPSGMRPLRYLGPLHRSSLHCRTVISGRTIADRLSSTIFTIPLRTFPFTDQRRRVDWRTRSAVCLKRSRLLCALRGAVRRTPRLAAIVWALLHRIIHLRTWLSRSQWSSRARLPWMQACHRYPLPSPVPPSHRFPYLEPSRRRTPLRWLLWPRRRRCRSIRRSRIRPCRFRLSLSGQKAHRSWNWRPTLCCPLSRHHPPHRAIAFPRCRHLPPATLFPRTDSVRELTKSQENRPKKSREPVRYFSLLIFAGPLTMI